MKISDNCLALVKHFEGCVLTAYPDPGTGGDPWTVGTGHAGPDVHRGLRITQEQADELLHADLAKFERGVSDLVTVPVVQHEFDALVSFAFNCGLANLQHSTLLRLLNAKDREGAAEQFGHWNRAAGHEMPGLTRRRAAEAAMFRGEAWQ